MLNKDAKKQENSAEATYKPVNVLDNSSYVKLSEPASLGFDNYSKSINNINDTYTHDVAAFYRSQI
jgi:hypothetical protein